MPVPSVSRSFIATAALAALTLTGVHAQSPATTDRIELSVDAAKTGAKIDRNLFGQFAEHLGRGIYEGVWVGLEPALIDGAGVAGCGTKGSDPLRPTMAGLTRAGRLVHNL